MKRSAVLALLVLAVVVIWASVAYVQAREEIKLTTIIPDQTTALFKKGVIGATYLTTFASNPDLIPDSALFVEGKVGIGTTNPATTLHLNGSGVTALRIEAGIDKNPSLQLWEDGTQKWAIFNSNIDDSMRFNTPGVDRRSIWKTALFLGADCNVGIGTTMPTRRLHILGSGPSWGIDRTMMIEATPVGQPGAAPGIAFVAPIVDRLITIGVLGSSGWANAWTYGSRIQDFVLTTGDDSPGNLLLGTRDSLISTSRARMAIMADTGNVGIGMLTPTHLLQLRGGAYCDGTGGWIAGSDKAYKKDIDYDFKYGIKEVERLKPVYYIHKEDKENKKQVGFIAQDVQKVVPELVSGEDGALGLSYGQLTAVLVRAVQEQQAQIESLNKKISDLEKRK